MIDFLMKTDPDGVVFKANSQKARDYCVEILQQMADPVYPAGYADSAKVLFEKQGFEVVDMIKRSSVDPLI